MSPSTVFSRTLFAVAIAMTVHATAFAGDDEDNDGAFAPEIVYKADLLSNLGGSLPHRTVYHGNLDLKLTVDGEKAYGLKGNTVFVYVLNNHGGHFNETVQALQGIDNIEVGISATRLFQVWMEQRFADDRFSVLAGLYDLNSEFYATGSSGILLNPSFGIGSDLAQTGENGPSIFPVSSLALRVKAKLAERGYVQAAILDAVAGDPDHLRGTYVKLDRNEGVLWIVEAGVELRAFGSGESSGKLGLGTWGYSERVDDVLRLDGAGNPRQVRNSGAYLLVDQPIPFAAHADKVHAFLRIGMASEDANAVRIGWQAGLTYEGLLPARENDVLAFGFAGAQVGSPYRNAVVAAGGARPRDELIVEMSYRAQLSKRFALQPDMQYVVRHVDPAIDDVFVIGLRAELSF